MRLLLDECVPKRLKDDLAGHDVSQVFEMGGCLNGSSSSPSWSPSEGDERRELIIGHSTTQYLS